MPPIKYDRLDYKKLTQDLIDVVQSSKNDPNKLLTSLTTDEGTFKAIHTMVEGQIDILQTIETGIKNIPYQEYTQENLKNDISALTDIKNCLDDLKTNLTNPETEKSAINKFQTQIEDLQDKSFVSKITRPFKNIINSINKMLNKEAEIDTEKTLDKIFGEISSNMLETNNVAQLYNKDVQVKSFSKVADISELPSQSKQLDSSKKPISKDIPVFQEVVEARNAIKKNHEKTKDDVQHAIKHSLKSGQEAATRKRQDQSKSI